MITSLHRRIAAISGSALLFALAATPARGGDAELLARCWGPADLAAKASERTPIKGAPGYAQRIPQTPLVRPDPVPAHLRGAIRRVTLPAGRKLVALTIDLCEASGEVSGYDGAIFDILREHKAKATIFTGGKWIMTHGERSQQLIADPLLEIASHGWAHRNVRGLDGRDLTQEINGPTAAFLTQRQALANRQCVAGQSGLAQKLQPTIGLYRFPFGACNPQALGAVADAGMLAIQWDISTGDASPQQSAQAIARSIADRATPGSIILAHGNGRGYNTAAALPGAIRQLRAKGFELVTVSELIAAGKPVIVDTCYDVRPGDTDKYDMFIASRRRPESPDGRASTPLPR